jgi:transcriptional regulator with XRE-family HTH domain
MKSVPQKIGWAIRKRREELNLSQEKLAEISHLHRTYISDVERGVRNVTIVSLSKILSGLGISLQRFFADYYDKH